MAAMLSARGGTPREPQQAWLTPREPKSGASGGGGDSLKMAGSSLLLQPGPLNGFRTGTDIAPDVRPAGKAGEFRSRTAHAGMENDIIVPTPRTPDGFGDVQKRHRRRGDAGEIAVHWGLKGVPKPDPGAGYGIKSNKGEDVAQNFRAGQVLGVAGYRNARGEAIYYSTNREPLGKCYNRGHRMPPKTQDPTFPGFGVATVKEMGAKEVMFPRGIEPETEEALRLYRRTHGSVAPGEMSTREYEFPKTVTDNPHFRFGSTDVPDPSGRGNGAKTALTMDVGEVPHSVPKANLVKDTLEHFRDVAHDHLGKPRSLLQGKVEVPKGHTYGMKSGTDEINAGQLLRGFYAHDEQLPDRDLGKCVTAGRRNFVSQAPFGMPSVRLDRLPPPLEKRSVTCATNYGDDLNAMSLIFPGKFQFQGIFDQDFLARRSADEIRGILAGAGYSLSDESFQAVFEHACELHGDGMQVASLEAAMMAYSDCVGHPQA